MSSGSVSNPIDPTSPLYLHPSDRTSSINIEKLQGASNYRPWRRSLEIALASKRKLGFVTGGVKRDENDKVKQECWDTCNNMVISWILGSVSESIKKSIMFMSDACEIWKHLENRYSITNGARKYSLSKQLYETKQSGRLVSEYYTNMKAIWVELENLNVLPAITTMTVEINRFVHALNEQKEEMRLFQFLNGLDEDYNSQRSQILMMSKLPSVYEACNMIQQEESQRELFKPGHNEVEPLAMHSKRADTVCSNCGKMGLSTEKFWAFKACGKPGHSQEKCWTVIGYPGKMNKPQRDLKGKGKDPMKGRIRPHKGKGKLAAHAYSNPDTTSSTGITTEQLEQLLRMLPVPSKGDNDDDTEVMDANYAEVMTCNLAQTNCGEWIMDSGATHHMTGSMTSLINVREAKKHIKINLSNGEGSTVTHCGDVCLENGIKLKNVMVIPEFNHCLMSIQKLTQDGGCRAIFLSSYCIIEEAESNEVKALGRAVKGVYYLVNEPIKKVFRKLKGILKQGSNNSYVKKLAATGELSIPTTVQQQKNKVIPTTLWHLSCEDEHNEHVENDDDRTEPVNEMSNNEESQSDKTLRRSSREHRTNG
ncbi:Retrovirus-related Pol polyprotein from transposon TNT 1-94 [Bienertia sinuspersici]